MLSSTVACTFLKPGIGTKDPLDLLLNFRAEASHIFSCVIASGPTPISIKSTNSQLIGRNIRTSRKTDPLPEPLCSRAQTKVGLARNQAPVSLG